MIGKNDRALAGNKKGVLKKFVNKPGAYRKLIAEAIFWTAVTRFVIRCLPFRTLLHLIQNSTKGNGEEPIAFGSSHIDGTGGTGTSFEGSVSMDKNVQDIVNAVTAVSRRMPWQCRCLVQASAAKILMNRRGIPNELCLGVLKPGVMQNSNQGEKEMRPHAWLIVGNRVVMGGEELARYVEVSRFV